MPNFSFDFRYTDGSSEQCNSHYDINATNEYEARMIAEERFERTHEFAMCDAYRDSRGWHNYF